MNFPPPPHQESATHTANDALSLDQTLWMWWDRFKKPLIQSTVFILTAALCFLGYRSYTQYRNSQIQAAFADTTSPEARLQLASQYPHHPLASLAQLESADLSFEATRYTEAVAHYDTAAQSLKGTPLEGRARLGAAVSLYRNQQMDQALDTFLSISNNPQLPGVIQAEAFYLLGLHYLENNNIPQAQSFFEKIRSVDSSGVWLNQASWWYHFPPLGSLPH